MFVLLLRLIDFVSVGDLRLEVKKQLFTRVLMISLALAYSGRRLHGLSPKEFVSLRADGIRGVFKLFIASIKQSFLSD